MEAMNQVKVRRKKGAKGAVIGCIFFLLAVAFVQLEGLHAKADSQTVSFTGYVTTEDDFATAVSNGKGYEDYAGMIYMKMMALSGLGVTFQDNSGKWVFYYFDGQFATNNTAGSNGKWTFDGTGSQLDAWNLVKPLALDSVQKSNPVPVKVQGYLTGKTATNTGLDADGVQYPVITVAAFNGVPTANAGSTSSVPSSSSTPPSSAAHSSATVSAVSSTASTASVSVSSSQSRTAAIVPSPDTGTGMMKTTLLWGSIAGAADAAVIALGRKSRARK